MSVFSHIPLLLVKGEMLKHKLKRQQQNQEQTSVFSVPQAPLNASAPQAATPPAAASAPHAEPAKPKAASEAEVKGGRA